MCKPLAFTARCAFLELHTLHTFHTFVVAESAVETPLSHAPGVRMTVVELTPSNYEKSDLRALFEFIIPRFHLIASMGRHLLEIPSRIRSSVQLSSYAKVP